MSKNIVLYSDGTGNRGGYGDSSNVYKMYLAVKRHHSGKKQITYYDDGVGTGDNQYLKAISGAIGFGLKKNVRDLYLYLGRHYDHQAGDQIFLFGFSRGAATIRGFTGFLEHCGLVIQGNRPEQEFQDLIDEALKAYEQRERKPELAITFKKNLTTEDCAEVPVHFVGVWDTVSALGYPYHGVEDVKMTYLSIGTKLFGTISNWIDKKTEAILPHRFYDFSLNDNIHHAYQALAIDDERKTFHPIVWNENGRAPDSVEQVWFVGAHSNVGGGHQRTELSDLTLHWMMVRAEAHGLELLDDDKNTAADKSNVHGKLYNSRDRLSFLYRYGPRDITNLCAGKLLGNIKIHDSVIDRIRFETQGYAPRRLPVGFDSVPTALNGANNTISFPSEEWNAHQISIKKYVEKRQLLYRIFIELILLIVVVSFYFWTGEEQVCGPDVWLLPHINDILHYIVPTYFENFVTYITCGNPFILLGILLTLFGLGTLRKKCIQQLNKAGDDLRQFLLKTCKCCDGD